MSTTTASTVIFAIPGGQETREFSLADARAAIARGEIELNHWAWSPQHNDWKQVSELPELQPDPPPVAKPVPVSQPKISPVAVSVATNASPVAVRNQPSIAHVVEEKSGFGLFKIFVVLLGAALLIVTSANYGLVDQRLSINLAQTKFSNAAVHAHLGAFFQPNAVVIHLLSDKTINVDNLADFLVALAWSTPQAPFSDHPFATVGLTSAWTSQYIMAGSDWQALGRMRKSTEDAKKAFILSHLFYPTGKPLLEKSLYEDPAAQAKRQDKAWLSLVMTVIHS